MSLSHRLHCRGPGWFFICRALGFDACSARPTLQPGRNPKHQPRENVALFPIERGHSALDPCPDPWSCRRRQLLRENCVGLDLQVPKHKSNAYQAEGMQAVPAKKVELYTLNRYTLYMAQAILAQDIGSSHFCSSLSSYLLSGTFSTAVEQHPHYASSC